MNGELKTVREDEIEGRKSLLETVYRDGMIVRSESFDAVRMRAQKELIDFHARVYPAVADAA